MTVEASLLIPFITAVLLGLIMFCFWFHDRSLMQSTAQLLAEASVYEEESAPVRPDGRMAMTVLTGTQAEGDASALQTARSLITGVRHGHAAVSGQMQIPVPLLSQFTGATASACEKAGAVRVDDTQDWFRSHYLTGRK